MRNGIGLSWFVCGSSESPSLCRQLPDGLLHPFLEGSLREVLVIHC